MSGPLNVQVSRTTTPDTYHVSYAVGDVNFSKVINFTKSVEDPFEKKIQDVWSSNKKTFEQSEVVFLDLLDDTYEIRQQEDTGRVPKPLSPRNAPTAIDIPSQTQAPETAATTSPLTETPSPTTPDQVQTNYYSVYQGVPTDEELTQNKRRSVSAASTRTEESIPPFEPRATSRADNSNLEVSQNTLGVGRSSVSKASHLSSTAGKVSLHTTSGATRPKFLQEKDNLDKRYSKQGMEFYDPWAGVYGFDKTIEESTKLGAVGYTIAKVVQFTTTALLVDLPISVGGIFAYGPIAYAAMTSEADPNDEDSIAKLKGVISGKISGEIDDMYRSIASAGEHRETFAATKKAIIQAVLQSDQFKSIARRLALRCSFYAIRSTGKKIVFFLPAVAISAIPGVLRETMQNPAQNPVKKAIIRNQGADPILELKDALAVRSGVGGRVSNQIKPIVSKVIENNPEWKKLLKDSKNPEWIQKMKEDFHKEKPVPQSSNPE